MSVRNLLRSFSAGELTPELYGRVDFAKFAEGLALCRNFITLAHGPAINRAGTQFISEVKDSSKKTRLIPFSYNSQQNFAIEVGEGYFRFHFEGSTLAHGNQVAYSGVQVYAIADLREYGGVVYYSLQAGNVGHTPDISPTWWYAMPADYYEIPNSYAAVNLMNIHYVQSSDVLTLVHPSYPPTELRRYGATDWRTSIPTFSPPTNYPTGVTATPTLAGAISYSYVVTSVAETTLQESSQSGVGSCNNDLTIAGHYNTVTWTAPSGAAPIRYNVYKLINGIYGYIGTSASLAFIDNNITPNVATTPPIYTTVMSSASNYPAAVSYHEQRRWFAGTIAEPQNFFATRSGTESDMSYSLPAKDDNALRVRIAAREASAILHILPISDLILLTASGEWKISSVNSGAITPTTLSVKPQSHFGASDVTPVIVGNVALYPSARGGHLREISFNWQANGYVSSDISLLATHLFDYFTILDMAFSKGPYPILWCISSTGKLLGMTYVLDNQIAAWHQHDTGEGDVFEACTTITEEDEDMLYVVVKRTINGTAKRYVERIHTRKFDTLADAFFIDCGATYYNAGTFSRTGTTMTITMVAHGLTTATSYSFAFSDTSFGDVPDGTAYVITVTGVDAFTITVPDAGATSGTVTQQVATLTGASWLEGREVNILVDGAVEPRKTITGGSVTFDTPGAKIQIGIPIQADLVTLPMAAQIDPAFGQGRPKNVNKVFLRLLRSSGILAGPDFGHLVPYPQRTIESYGTPPYLMSKEIEITLTPTWGESGQMSIRQNDPLPVNLASITLEVAVEGG